MVTIISEEFVMNRKARKTMLRLPRKYIQLFEVVFAGYLVLCFVLIVLQENAISRKLPASGNPNFVLTKLEASSRKPTRRSTTATSAKRTESDTSKLHRLLAILHDQLDGKRMDSIIRRITSKWNSWNNAARSLSAKQNSSRTRRTKTIFLHLGLLTDQQKSIHEGGMQAELIQWSDLIAALFILGHDIMVTTDNDQLTKLEWDYDTLVWMKGGKSHVIDLIYTDILGVWQLQYHVQGGYIKYRYYQCLLRVLDSFGTEPQFNLRRYTEAKNISINYGGLDIIPQQFLTMYPHTADNTFLGFSVERSLLENSNLKPKRRNMALIYGDTLNTFKGKWKFLSMLNQSGLELHAALDVRNNPSFGKLLPYFVANHGVLSDEEYLGMLRRSKVLVGLGDPVERPGPLEAIANGAIFLNSKFEPPRSRTNDVGWSVKPTARQVTCQNSYAEEYIGEPYVFTVNTDSGTEVLSALQKIKDAPNKHYLRYEFTEEGFLQRLDTFIEHQDFCTKNKQHFWPPTKEVTVVLGDEWKSCNDACKARDLTCEPSHFKRANSKEALQTSGVTCTETRGETDIYYPAVYTSAICILQDEPLLFSCAGERQGLRRLCPCRTFDKEQTALCRGCYR